MEMVSIAVELALNQALSILDDHKFNTNVEHFKEEIYFLVGNLKIVRSLLLDAESKNLETESIKGWLQTVEAVAIDADDMLEEYAYEGLQHNIEVLEGKDRKVSSQVFPSSFVSEMVCKIKEISLSLDIICQESAEIGLIPLTKNGSEEHEVGLIDDYIYEIEVFGRENDVMKLTGMLIDSDNQKDLSVVSVPGIGGQGKTTVARLVYENPDVVKHFDHRIWVNLTEDCDVRIFHEMVESITGYDILRRKSKEAITRHLRIILKCRRYLIVCDDVCNENSRIWESMEKDFHEVSSSRGSKMMVITRSQQKMFKKRVFGRGRKATSELVDIGKRLVDKCRGVPLAIELLSGFLRSKKGESEWSRISATWASTSDSDVVLEAIRLNFDNLPNVFLKQCFLYCSVFPKNYLMERESLIQIWMAQRLLNSSSNEHTLEATGDHCFNFLLQTSLLREQTYDDFSTVNTCKMHGLVHDFASHISKNYCTNMKLRYMNGNTDSEVVDLSANHRVNFQRLRALYFVGETFGDMLKTNIRCRLYVLILDGENIKELPSLIGELKYLRYLDVSRTSINMLPDSIVKLYNLQTLRVDRVQNLPEKFTNLKNLRHVYGILHIPRIGELVNLQTIPGFFVNGEKGCNKKELETLDNLKGKLIIYEIQNESSKEEASKSDLSRKYGITNLELHWQNYRKDDCNAEEVLEVLKPHFNLRVLRISRFTVHNFPSWMMTSNNVHLCNLVQIQLEDCKQCVEILALGHLPNLQLIEMHMMDNVKCIGSKFYGLDELGSTGAVFPSLRKLRLSMVKLEDWLGVRNSPVSSSRIVFPCLQELILDFCKRLTNLPEMDCLDSLLRLTISNCDELTSLPDWIQSLGPLQDFSLNYSSLNCLPEMNSLISLQRISIKFCESVIHFPSLSCLTSLQKLEIIACGNLITISSVSCSVETLSIQSCYKLNDLPELHNVSALQKLEVSYCNNIVSIPNVPSGLRSLLISCCNRLKAIPGGLEACNFLENVCITGCSSLENLDGLQHLTYLRRLEIGEFSEHLDHFPWQNEFHFQYLESLKLVGWYSLKSLPGIQQLPPLRELKIEKFFMLVALPEWLGDLEMLEWLYISSCDRLMYLPSAEAMQRLVNLQSLDVCECPLLKKRWVGNGPEWHKVSHIPNIGISDGFL
ncbi:antimicrobial response protein [Lithospermum erythrorhizon]|uniref:Antimicrobial response protein n=1 Tax=Lithospermum erythrorhizon TaxID=34254 RepID=A0AAV3R6S7_LITER